MDREIALLNIAREATEAKNKLLYEVCQSALDKGPMVGPFALAMVASSGIVASGFDLDTAYELAAASDGRFYVWNEAENQMACVLGYELGGCDCGHCEDVDAPTLPTGGGLDWNTYCSALSEG